MNQEALSALIELAQRLDEAPELAAQMAKPYADSQDLKNAYIVGALSATCKLAARRIRELLGAVPAACGVHQAIVAGDLTALVREMSARANPNTPDDALRLAVRQLTDRERWTALAWAEAWLRDPNHDALRARGDRRWEVMSRLHALLLEADEKRLSG